MGVLSQYVVEGELHSEGYSSKVNSPAEYNYDMYEIEHMASINFSEEWRLECEGTQLLFHLLMECNHYMQLGTM